MGSTSGDDGWGEFHKRFAVQGLPQIPDEALARRIDDACRDHACGIAAEPHRHRERLFAMRARAPEQEVEVECDTG